MAASNFAACLKTTLEFEGGWSNHPRDPGGATMRGVIQRTYDAYRKRKGLPLQSVRNISDAELHEIYRKDYWDAVNGDGLAAGVDLATFDFGVNSGPARARKYLMAVIGGSAVDTVKRLCAKRLSFVRGLSTFDVFGAGWTRRIATVEARAVKMALQAEGKSAEEVKRELTEAASKSKTKSTAQGGGAATGTTAGGATVDQVATWDWPTIIGIGIGVVVVAFLVWHAVHNWHRYRAYIQEALS